MSRKELWQAGQLPPVLVINRPSDEPVTRGILAALKEPPSSAMSLPLVVEDFIVGALAVIARGDDRFTEDHARLYTTLKEPFFVALSNTFKHEEVVKLKDTDPGPIDLTVKKDEPDVTPKDAEHDRYRR